MCLRIILHKYSDVIDDMNELHIISDKYIISDVHILFHNDIMGGSLYDIYLGNAAIFCDLLEFM